MRLLALVLLLLSSTAHAAINVVSWTHPTQYVTGAQIEPGGIVGTEIEYGECGADSVPVAPAQSITLPYPAATWTHAGLKLGQRVCYRARTLGKTEPSAWTGGVWGLATAKPGRVQGVEIK